MATRRVRRPKDQEAIYKELTDKKEFGMFNTYKDVFMLGLVVGFLEGKRVSFDQTLEEINWQIFSLDTDEAVINMITYLETNDFDVLYSDSEESFDQKITISEEYAAGGVKKIYEIITADQQHSMEVLIDYLQNFEDMDDETYTKKQLREGMNL